MKRIFIDGLGLVDGHFSGVGQYILGILRGLDEILEKQKYRGEAVPEIYVIIPRDMGAKFRKFGFKHLGYKLFPLSFRVMSSLWYRGKMPPLDLLYGRGVYIFPRFVDMRLVYNKSIVVVYDLSYEHSRQYSDDKNAVFLSKGVRRSIDRAQKVIAISKNTRRELIDFYELNESMVLEATPATDPHIFYRRSPSEIDKVKQKYGIKGDYILALSNLEPRKNLDALVDVYCRLPKRIRDNNSLLLVGVSGWKTDELFSKIVTKVNEGFKIIRPSSYVSDKHKPAIISGAKMLVYPSHYEGFGIPPLEALACGVPVITADNSSLPEVVGKIGRMISSTNKDELYKAIVDYFNELDEVSARVLIEGPMRSRKFSWPASAKVILDAAMEIKR